MSSQSEEVKIPGKTITLGGREFVLPPISVRISEEHADIVDRFGEKSNVATLQDMAIIVHACLLRNYSEEQVQLDFVKEYVDFGNLQTLAAALFGKVFAEGN